MIGSTLDVADSILDEPTHFLRHVPYRMFAALNPGSTMPLGVPAMVGVFTASQNPASLCTLRE